jgi:hypothetical protein
MAICTKCGQREAAGFFDPKGLFVDTLTSEVAMTLGFKPICRPCAAVQVEMSYDSSQPVGLDDLGNPEGNNGSRKKR